jgi:phospholipid-binding lipoprotein MlaA
VYAVSDGWRFLINTTVGVAGLFDVASNLHIPAHHEDFGLTLAYWGMVPQPYLMLPLLGPSSPRDAIGLVADYAASPWPYIRPWWIPTLAVGIRTINYRASLLPADKLLENSLDPYVFVRDAHIQTRHKQIEDNKLTYDQYAAKNRATFSQDISTPDTLGTDLGTMASPPPSVAEAAQH